MKLVSCYLSGEEIAPLIEAGAGELYTSVPELPSFAYDYLKGLSIEAAIKRIHALGARALVAANSPYVVRDRAQMRALLERLHALDRAGADAFIVANPALLSLLSSGRRRLRAELHLSSVQPCFNAQALKFFLRFGIRRLILPTQLAPLEARELLALCRREGVETEIFDYRFFGCVYVNGRCNLHVPRYHTFRDAEEGGSLCRCGAGRPLRVKPFDVQPGLERTAAAAGARLARRMGAGGAPRLYNAASFYDFFRLGAGYLKYGVRLDPLPEKVRKVRAMRGMADLAAALTAEHGPEKAREFFIRRMCAWGRP